MSNAELTQEELTIFNTINNAEDGITMEKILLQIGQSNSYRRIVSEIISSLIIDHNIPIGSSSTRKAHKFGFFVIRDENDKRLAIQTLKSRVDGINKRQEKIKNIEV